MRPKSDFQRAPRFARRIHVETSTITALSLESAAGRNFLYFRQQNQTFRLEYILLIFNPQKS